MILKRLAFCGFRNLEDGGFEPGEGVNLLYGDNAQGKTNLIEAVWLFTGTRSFRGAKDGELVRTGRGRALLEMDFEAKNKRNSAKIEITGRRRAFLNGEALGSCTGLAGEFCAVVFSPEHLSLVKDGPQPRRRFLDTAIGQIQPRHISKVVEYSRALIQKNALLKDVVRHSELLDTMAVWDEKLCLTGAQITYTRLRYLAALTGMAKDFYSGISKGKERLSFDYRSPARTALTDGTLPRGQAVLKIKGALQKSMKENLAGDIACGYARAGPHRDDLEILVDGLSARSFASQGQQRSVVLALKLSEAAVLRQYTYEPPVLLLDDVLSELDLRRQDYLLNHIGDSQVFITCCGPIGAIKSGRLFEVDGGRITAK
jgi:DNA replication and repair protein RecF